MATVSFSQFSQGKPVTQVDPKTPLMSAVDKNYAPGSKDNYTRYSEVPGVSQLSNIGVGIGTATGNLLAGAAKVGLKAASTLGKVVGADTKYADQYVDAADKTQKFFGQEGEFKEPLSTTSGKVGTAIGNTTPYILSAGAVNPATMNLSYGTQVLARTLPDIAIAASQSGGDAKQTATAGLISAASNALLPGSGGSVDTVQNFLKTEAKSTLAGYTADVVSGLAGNRGEDRTGIKAGIPGWSTIIGASIPVAQVGAQEAKVGINKAKEGVSNYFSKDRIVDSLEDDINKIAGETKTGIKTIQRSQSQGKDPARVLAENGIQPNKEGLKYRTNAQADQFIKENTPKLESVLQDGLKEVDISNPQGQPIRDLLPEARETIDSSSLTPFDKINAKNRLNAQVSALVDKYGENASLENLNIEKKNFWTNKNFNSGEPWNTDVDYAMGKSIKNLIQNSTEGLPVQELNSKLGDIYDSASFLKSLDGNAVKGGRLGKYVYQAIGSTLGETLPGKIAGAFVGDQIFTALADSSDPVKTMILKNLQKTDPEAYTKALQFIADQRLERSLQPKLPPAGGSSYEEPPMQMPKSQRELNQSIDNVNSKPALMDDPNPYTKYGTKSDRDIYLGGKPPEVEAAQTAQTNERAMDYYNRTNQAPVKTMQSDMRSAIADQPLLTQSQLQAKNTPLKPASLSEKYKNAKMRIESSDAFNVDKAIEAGDVPRESVYIGNTDKFTPEMMAGRVDDIALKLDKEYEEGLGRVFKFATKDKAMTQKQLQSLAVKILQDRHLGLSLADYLPKK